MKRDRLRKVVSISFGVVALTLGSAARADVGPPVEIRMSLDGMRQAVAGEQYAGVFEVHVHRAGTLADFKLLGDGWILLSLETPGDPVSVQPGVVRIPFRAVPADADEPIGLSLTYDGRRVAKSAAVGPAHFARAGKPYRLIQVPGTSVPTADELERGLRGDGEGGPPDGDGTRRQLQFEGRIVYTRPCRDMSDPDTGDDPDGDCDDPWDIPLRAVGVDHIDVRVLDNDDFGTEEIWSGHTDENGYFETPVIDWDDGSDIPDLILYCETEVAGVVDVTDSDWEEYTYTFQTGEIENFEGSYYDFGWYFPASAPVEPALHIFNSVVRTRRYIEEKPAYITPEVQVEWPDDSKGGGAWYERGPVEIHMSTEQQWHNETVGHEYGHHFIMSTYDPDPPDPDYCEDPSCDPDPPDDCGHCIWCQETDHDAWNEGFPNWLADIVTRDYPDRYTHDINGPPYIPLYTLPQEWSRICDDSSTFEDPIKTEGFVAALLRDMEDQTQDDHDDDPNPTSWSSDGIFDLMCLGPVEIFRVTYLDQPTTVLDFINAFLTRYPEYTDLFWPTAFNVGGSAYVSGFPADTQPPGAVLYCNSPTHPHGEGNSLPCITFEWWAASDDVSGASAYSFLTTPDPAGEEPDENAEDVWGTDTCGVAGTVEVWELGEHYFCIKARDNAGNWSSQWSKFGPFEIIDCNGSGILDACDISCGHHGISGICWSPVTPCTGQPGCGQSSDCDDGVDGSGQPNLIPDECDIANGTSQDCNLNGVPDECEDMYHWDGASGSWHTAGDWREGEPPATDSHVCINVPGDQTVTYSTGASTVATLACSESLDITDDSVATLTLNEPSWVDGDLGLSGNNSVLEVNDRLDIGGLFEWTGASVSNSAKLAGSGVTYANGGAHINQTVHLEGHHLILDGNSTSAGAGSVYFISPSVFEIRPGSTYEHQGGRYFLNGWNTDSFVNGGTLIKSVDPGESTIYAHIDNSGLIHLQTGMLTFYWGGSSTGDFLGDPGTTLAFNNGYHFLPDSSIVADNVLFPDGGCTVQGTYDVTTATTSSAYILTFTDQADIISYGSSFYIDRWTVNFNAIIGGPIQFDTLSVGPGASGTAVANFNSGDPVHVTDLTLRRGTIQVPSSITITGLTTWDGGGYFDCDGTGTVNANGNVLVNYGGDSKSLSGCVFNNAATATLLGSFGLGSGAVFNNLATGVVDIQVDSGYSSYVISGFGQTFNNDGTLLKSAGDGISTIAGLTTNSGTVEIQTGVLRFNTYYSGYYTQTAGQTILNGGDLTMDGPSPLSIVGGLLTGDGTITGNVIIYSEGTAAPGVSVGVLDIVGPYTQTAGSTLEIEIDGLNQGSEYDLLTVSGAASLAGNLEVALINGFEPDHGDTFQIVRGASVTGEFEHVNITNLPPGMQVVVYYSPTTVTLIVPPVDGDCNEDYVVGIGDVSEFVPCLAGPQGGLGQDCDCADIDGDGDVDLGDVSLLQVSFTGPLP